MKAAHLPQLQQAPAPASDETPYAPPLKLYLESYGCQMNEYDSALVRSLFAKAHYDHTKHAEEAQLILLNTCAIREKAQERIYTRLESLGKLKLKSPALIIGILGCMAQNLGDDLLAMGLPVDFVAGPDNYRDLPKLVKEIQSSEQRETRWKLTQLSRTESYEDLRPHAVSGKLAFVSIMRGCDNFCSFCVVPYTRGRERSRSPASIIEELLELQKKYEIQEVTLLGQNVNSYNWQGVSFHGLIRSILRETDIARLRFTSPHPRDFPEELLELMADELRFCSQIHLPLQSGSSRVLERMKRGYSRIEYMALVRKIRSYIPQVGLSTDIIVGFCGETERDFQETLELVEEARFDMAYMFSYSEREHTSAKKYLPDDVPKEEKQRRLSILIERQQRIASQINKGLEGQQFQVLVEARSRRSQADLMGRTYTGKVLVFPIPAKKEAEQLIGKSIPVLVQSSSSATLKGTALAC